MNACGRERRRDVIENGLDSPFFAVAIQRMLEFFKDMEDRLASSPWLVGAEYTIADAAFTPYVVRLDHLDIMGLLDGFPRVRDWYSRLQTRSSFQDAIVKWENADYLTLMKREGRENMAKIRQVACR
jgi:glutathione S-transferase